MPCLGSANVHDDLGASLSAYAPLARLFMGSHLLCIIVQNCKLDVTALLCITQISQNNKSKVAIYRIMI